MISSTDDYLKLYDIFVKEEQHFLESHQTRVKFYTSIISALLVATVAGILKSTEWHHYLLMLVGPTLSFFVSVIALDGTFRLYQRFLESVSMRAKIEQIIGMTKQTKFQEDNVPSYWDNESIVPPRHLQSRIESKSTENFIKTYSKKGYHRSTHHLFRIFQILSAIMFIIISIRAVW